jgi:hypothetical protein
LVGSLAHAGGIVIVSGDTAAGENQPGWLFNRDVSTSTPFEFNRDAAAIGLGSLYVAPIGTNPADKFIGELFLLTPVADLSLVSYDFMIGAGGDTGDAVQFYMNVYMTFGESDSLKFYDCRYDIVPASGSLTAFTTVTFDPSMAYPVTTRSTSPHPCPSAPADMDISSSGSRVRAIALNVGDTSANDVGLDGYLDNVVVVTTADMVTYNLDPAPTKGDCKKGGWQTLGFANQGQCVRFVETGKAPVVEP